MGEMERKDIKRQTHVRGHLQVGERARSSAAALARFERVVAYKLGRTGGSDERDVERRHIPGLLPETGPPSVCDATSPRPSGEGSRRQQGFRVAMNLLPSPLWEEASGLGRKERDPRASHNHSLAHQEALAGRNSTAPRCETRRKRRERDKRF